MSEISRTDAFSPALVVRWRTTDIQVYVEKDGKGWILDEVGSFIWRRVEERRTVAEIVGDLAQTYEDVEIEELEADAIAFLNELVELGVLKRSRT